MAKDRFDLTGVLDAFLRGTLADRRGLVETISKEMCENPVVKRLVIEVADRAVQGKKSPVDTIGISLMYGMVLGVCLERERLERERKIN